MLFIHLYEIYDISGKRFMYMCTLTYDIYSLDCDLFLIGLNNQNYSIRFTTSATFEHLVAPNCDDQPQRKECDTNNDWKWIVTSWLWQIHECYNEKKSQINMWIVWITIYFNLTRTALKPKLRESHRKNQMSSVRALEFTHNTIATSMSVCLYHH